MKKLYIQPAMMLVKVGTETMICTSYNPNANSNPTPEQGKGENALSKRRGGIFGSDDSDARNGIW